MKKIIIIGIIFIFILLIAVIGSILVTPANEVKQIEDILNIQKGLDEDYSCYGYTIDNPRIVINPYKVSLLSALIMFETEEEKQIEVYLYKKDGTKYLLYKEEVASRQHYLDIYGMYANYDNKVRIVMDSLVYDYTVSTKLDINLDKEKPVLENNKISFINYDKDLVGLNEEGEVIYYFKGYNVVIKQLDNGHLLITSSRHNNDETYIGFSEIDMVGKIYNDYIIENGYHNLIEVMENGNYLVLSNNLIEIDKQNGKVINEFNLEDNNYDYLYYNNKTITIGNTSGSYIYNYDTKKLDKTDEKVCEKDNYNIQINTGNYYKKFKQNRFGENKETKTKNSFVNLLFYKEVDKNYNKYKINFTKEYDRIIVTKDIKEDILVILDSFGDKRVYEVKGSKFYINTTKLKGTYSIYTKVKGKIYKTSYYVKS